MFIYEEDVLLELKDEEDVRVCILLILVIGGVCCSGWCLIVGVCINWCLMGGVDGRFVCGGSRFGCLDIGEVGLFGIWRV